MAKKRSLVILGFGLSKNKVFFWNNIYPCFLVLTAFVLWVIILIRDGCSGGFLVCLSKLPLPFVTKIYRFWYDWEMFEILADPGII